MIPLSKHCLDLKHWTKDHYLFFFNLIQSLKQKPFQDVPALFQGQFIGMIFQEPSTRTRVSFQKACMHMKGEPIWIENHSSLKKGETIFDTVKTLHAMGIEDFVIRSSHDEIFSIAEQYDEGILLNAGSGSQHHPTQGLLDAFTIWEHFGSLEGLKILMVGDLKHSRVARSNLEWMKVFDVTYEFAGPREWIDQVDAQASLSTDFESSLTSADVVMLHRVQKERFDDKEALDIDAYVDTYSMNQNRMMMSKKNNIVMHPGPFNRGIEITDDVVSHERSKILNQVCNGVWVRIGLLKCLKEMEAYIG